MASNQNDDKSDDDSDIVVIHRKKPTSDATSSRAISTMIFDDDDDDDFVADPYSKFRAATAQARLTATPSPAKSYGLRSKNNETSRKRKVVFQQEDGDESDTDTATTATATISDVDDDDDFVDNDRSRGAIEIEESDDYDNEIRNELNKSDGKRRRRILRTDELEVSTRRAIDEEMARQKRVLERQKSFGSDVANSLSATLEDLPELVDEESCNASIVRTAAGPSLVFEADQFGRPILQVHPEIASKLKQHQIEANKFMYDCVCESLEQLNNPSKLGSGCIIAHCMGLGKTLTTIAFVHTLLDNRNITGVRTCLILAPLNAQLNWVSEFGFWLPDEGVENYYEEGGKSSSSHIDVHHLTAIKKMADRAMKLREWHVRGGVMVLGYTMYRMLVQACQDDDPDSEPEIEPEVDLDTPSTSRRRGLFGRPPPAKKKKTSKKPKFMLNLTTRQKEIFYETLVKPGPDIVIFDEGHVLKSATSALSMTLSQIATRRRIVLTGTPLQNNLMEYHCMVSFVKPGLLGTAKEFSNRFATPIKNGESKDASEDDVFVMKRRISVLYRILQFFVHRKGFEHLRDALPPKYEYVLMLRSTREQTQIYGNYLERVVQVNRDRGASVEEVSHLRQRLFADYYALRYVCSHPYLLYVARRRAIEEQAKAEQKAMASFDVSDVEDFDNDEGGSDFEGLDAEVSDLVDDMAELVNGARKRRQTMARLAATPTRKPPQRRMMLEVADTWYSTVVGEECAVSHEVSSKIMILMELLRSFEAVGDKTLIFSQSLLFLNLIEDMLGEEEHRRAATIGDASLPYKTWRNGRDYFRIDGSVNAADRSDMINRFNNQNNPRARLFLISTRAGGIGVNLVAANRCIILDISWNPCNDSQALFRTYRFGQTKSVYVYRLVSSGTMEEKIYDRQVVKQALSGRVVDAKQILRHFTAREILQLYEFDAQENSVSPANLTDISSFPVPKDSVFADLLLRRSDLIKSYLDHDSLLAHQEHEQLSEADRMAAWHEYESEQKGLAIDIHNPAMSHLKLMHTYMSREMLSAEAASEKALAYLRDEFGSIAPEIRDYVAQKLNPNNNMAPADGVATTDPYQAAAATAGTGDNLPPIDLVNGAYGAYGPGFDPNDPTIVVDEDSNDSYAAMMPKGRRYRRRKYRR